MIGTPDHASPPAEQAAARGPRMAERDATEAKTTRQEIDEALRHLHNIRIDDDDFQSLRRMEKVDTVLNRLRAMTIPEQKTFADGCGHPTSDAADAAARLEIQAATLDTAITAYGRTEYCCGEWSEDDHTEPYPALAKRRSAARNALVALIRGEVS